MDDGSGLGDDFDGERSEPCCSGLTLASGALDCESDEQQMATQEWRSDASALRPEIHPWADDSGVGQDLEDDRIETQDFALGTDFENTVT